MQNKEIMVAYKPKISSCSIINQFIDVCNNTGSSSRNIRFIIIDQLNDKNSYSPYEIDNLLLQKKRFSISTLLINKGLNSTELMIINAILLTFYKYCLCFCPT